MSRSFSIIFILIALSSASFGQDVSASIIGNVKDSSGAVVPGAKVTATNLDTNISKSTTSGAGGDFLIPLLRPGKYSLTVSQTGFKTYEETVHSAAATCLSTQATSASSATRTASMSPSSTCRGWPCRSRSARSPTVWRFPPS